jgi:YggT family protein
MGYALGQTFFSLFELSFDVYIALVMLRFILQWVKADFKNPFCQFLMRMTNPLLLPLRRVVSGMWGLDMAAVVLMLALKTLEFFLMSFFIDVYMLTWDYVLIVPISIIHLGLNVFFFAIIVRSILSWVKPDPRHPLTIIMYQLTEPLLAPVRSRIPPIGGLDLAPMIVLVGILLLSNFVRLWLGV